MRTTFFVLALLVNLAILAQSKPNQEPAAMKEDFAYLRQYLERTHPMLYIHHTPETAKAMLDSLAGTLEKPLPFLDFYKKIAFLVAQVGCEHTSAGYGDGFEKFIRGSSLFPYQLYFMHNKVFVTVNMTKTADIRPGDELLSINNYPIDSIRHVLHQYIPLDGHIISAKDNQLSSMAFNIWYYLYVEQPGKYKISVRTQEGKLINKTVEAVKFNDLNKQAVNNSVNKLVFELEAKLKAYRKESLSLELFPEKRAALLAVRSFVSDMDKFRHKIDSLFKIIALNKTEKLIINVANNGGGEVELAADLLNYFITSPTSIVEYSYLLTDKDEDLKMASLPDEIHKAKYDYITPMKDGKSYAKLSKYAGELKQLQPRADRFAGKVYLYANGGTASAASTFAAVMKSLGLATIVGEETAGAYGGGGTVIGLDLKLPNSKITVHSGLIYQRQRTSGGDLSRGVIPDLPFEISFDDILAGNRSWLNYILELK